jgi:hypothetical protein
MDPLLIFALVLLLLLLGSLLVIYNFVRYRFRGDLTLAFITSYLALFVLIVVITLSLISVSGATP